MTAAIFERPLESLASGERFETPRRTITETDVICFAALSGDMHPAHVDAEWADAGRFGERIAHGLLIVSYAIGLIPFDARYVVALRALRDVVFKRPVKIGATIGVAGQITDVKALDETLGLVTVRLEIGERERPAACILSIEALWRAGASASAPPAAPREAWEHRC
jgi:3-hydroxybutyryl-CoA dehydratase